MMFDDLQIGDILVTLGRSPLSYGIKWWTHSDFSHVMPVVDGGKVLDTKWPRPQIIDPHTLKFNRVVHLRPVRQFKENQRKVWSITAYEIARTGRYDVASFIGMITGTGSQSHSRYNCAEATLECCHAVGMLLGRTQRLLTPQTFLEFAHGGMFEILTDRKRG